MPYTFCTDSETIALVKSLPGSKDPDLLPMIDDHGILIMDGMVANNRGDGWVMGGVNIGNRIFTEGKVTLIDGGKYRITPAVTVEADVSPAQMSFLMALGMAPSASEIHADPEVNVVTALIDGVEYSGYEILVDKNQVTVHSVPDLMEVQFSGFPA